MESKESLHLSRKDGNLVHLSRQVQKAPPFSLDWNAQCHPGPLSAFRSPAHSCCQGLQAPWVLLLSVGTPGSALFSHPRNLQAVTHPALSPPPPCPSELFPMRRRGFHSHPPLLGSPPTLPPERQPPSSAGRWFPATWMFWDLKTQHILTQCPAPKTPLPPAEPHLPRAESSVPWLTPPSSKLPCTPSFSATLHFFLFQFYRLFVFLGLYLWPMESPRLGVESEL